MVDFAFFGLQEMSEMKLPSEIRDEDNFERFKSKLKTFLFRAAYPIESS